MSTIGSSGQFTTILAIARQENIPEKTNDLPIDKKETKPSVDELKISENTEKGSVPVTSLNIDEQEKDITQVSENSLPEIRVQESSPFKYFFNAFGRQINTLKKEDGMTFTTMSEKGFSIILKQNDAKRDVLVFSNMSDKIPKNSRIPNVYFLIEGKENSNIHFDQQHNIVIELKNKEKLVIDGKDGITILEGPFKPNFNPETPGGTDFRVTYTGKGHLKANTSFGDKIPW